jgi:hypothetical protein
MSIFFGYSNKITEGVAWQMVAALSEKVAKNQI